MPNPVPPQLPANLHMPARTFHPRRGRMGQQKQQALTELLPRYRWVAGADPWPDGDVVMEIGFGMGDATAQMAAAAPGTTWIAVDIHTPGVAHLSRVLDTEGIDNVRICVDDALDVLTSHVPHGSLAAVHVFFPDPWPKARHRFRRLVQQPFLDLAATALAPGGTLHAATDWADYAEQMVEVIGAHPAFRRVDAPVRPVTKYERIGLAAGRAITDVAAQRR